MYVCVCNGITDQEIRAEVAQGVSSLDELTRRTGCGDCCGSCVEFAAEILAESAHTHVSQPRMARPLGIPVLTAGAPVARAA